MKKIVNIILVIFILVPILLMLLWSFSGLIPWPGIFPEGFTADVWQDMLMSKGFFISIFYSIYVSLCVTAIVVLISIPASIALTQYDLKWKNFFWILVLLPFFIPSISMAIGLHSIYIKLSLTDSFIGVVLCHIIPTVPYAIRILCTSLELLGRDMRDQAMVLGADEGQIIMYVYLPNLKSAAILASILVFIVSFSQYLMTFLIGGGIIKTLPIVMFQIMQSGSRAEISAYSLVFILTAMTGTVIIEKILGKRFNKGYA